MQIGELSKKSGFSRDTIRFYEKIGLIKLEEDDWRNRYQSKDYSEGVLRRLMAIRKMKEYGFTLNETKGLFILFEEGVLEPVRGKRYVERKIQRIDQQINELMTMKAKLQEVVDAPSCTDCPIGQVLYSMSC
ncbi:MAG TPA: MerR family transcriptional regulator [Puia sp.]|jgi:DNA-binding transcriptional MerR regulator|nr:MerR family transcriptional regulator [Puia sp.]